MLFDTTSVGSIALNNRIGVAPMTRVSATKDGLATDEMAQYYAKFAQGGFSFVVTEGIYTDNAYSKGYLNQPGLVTADHTESWRPVVKAVKDSGGAMIAQLMHCGAQNQGIPSNQDQETIAPSAIRPDGEKKEAYGGDGEYPTPKQATQNDLKTAKEGFVMAAQNALKAGFDGVELHGANGYFLNEFLSTSMNHRDDEYGGAPAGRVRYPADVLSAVVDAVPSDFVVGIRISQSMVTDYGYEWPEGEDAAAVFFRDLSATGAEFIHTTERHAGTPTFGEDGPSLAEAANEYSTNETIVIANGGLGTPDDARDMVASAADLVTLARPALANPDWPCRVASEKELAEFNRERILRPDATISEHELSIAHSNTL